MHLSDCASARYYFNGRVAMYDPEKVLTFWSRRWTVRPPEYEFELPFGTKYSESSRVPNISKPPRHAHYSSICCVDRAPPTETCTILMRMAKDFGDNVLPIGDTFMHESDDLPQAQFTWEDILDSLDDLQEHIVEHQAPGWAYGYNMGAQFCVVMIIPSSSVMSRRWATGMRAGSGDVLVGANDVAGSVE
ncbi:MAG: hypothetical protein Q9184_007078 [Pyrenodesmia sp. 2 TL-2023]